MKFLCRCCKLLFPGFFEMILFALRLGDFDSWIVKFSGGNLPKKVEWFMGLGDSSNSKAWEVAPYRLQLIALLNSSTDVFC